MSTFDILIPCYNYGRYLDACVRSVTEQDCRLRILIIDDASTDETEEIGRSLARLDPRIEYRRHTQNRGHIATYNEGIEWADSTFFLLLSADDLLLPGALARIRDAFARCDAANLVFGRTIYFGETASYEDVRVTACRVQRYSEIHAIAVDDETGMLPEDLREGLPDLPALMNARQFFRLNRWGNRVHASSAVVRTAAQKALGGYRAELPHAGDLELWLRLAAHGPVAFVSQFQTAARMHAASMSQVGWSSPIKDAQQRLLAYECIERHAGGPTKLTRMLRRHLAYSLLSRALLSGASAADVRSFREHARRCDPRILTSPLWWLSPVIQPLLPMAKNLAPRIMRQALGDTVVR